MGLIKGKVTFRGYFSVFLSLTILAAALIYLIYGYAPYQYYLPLSFVVVLVVGIAGFVILSRKIEI
jgi:hypothetical protein